MATRSLFIFNKPPYTSALSAGAHSPRTAVCALVTSSHRDTMLAWDFSIICGGIAGECRCSALSARVNLGSLVLLRGLSYVRVIYCEPNPLSHNYTLTFLRQPCPGTESCTNLRHFRWWAGDGDRVRRGDFLPLERRVDVPNGGRGVPRRYPDSSARRRHCVVD